MYYEILVTPILFLSYILSKKYQKFEYLKNPLLYVRRKIFFKILIFAITAKSFLTHAFAIDFKRWVIEFEQQQNVFQGFANNDSWSWLSKNATSTQKNSRIKTNWALSFLLLGIFCLNFFAGKDDVVTETWGLLIWMAPKTYYNSTCEKKVFHSFEIFVLHNKVHLTFFSDKE